MHLSIYIIDANKVILEARLYVTKDIKTDVILNNNILELSQNKISLYLYSKQMQIDRIQISIEFISSIATSINFYVIFIIVSTTLKSCLKLIDKQTTKTIKFVIRKKQEKRINIIKIDALSQCSSIASIAFATCKINNYQMLRFASSNVEKISFRFISEISSKKISKTSK